MPLSFNSTPVKPLNLSNNTFANGGLLNQYQAQKPQPVTQPVTQPAKPSLLSQIGSGISSLFKGFGQPSNGMNPVTGKLPDGSSPSYGSILNKGIMDAGNALTGNTPSTGLGINTANAQTAGTNNNIGTTGTSGGSNTQTTFPLASNQTTTQGNQASPQPVPPTSVSVTPTAPPVSPTSVSVPTNVYNSSTQNLNNQGQGNQTTANASTGLLNQSNSIPQGAINAQGLLNQFATSQTPAVTQAQDMYNKTADNPYMMGALTNSGMAESVSAGAGAQFAQNYVAQLAAKQQEVQNALTGQGQQIGSAENMGSQALTGQQQQIGAGTAAGNIGNTSQQNQITAQNNAGGLTKPEADASFFGSPQSGGVVGEGNNLVNTAVSQATQMVQNGADPATVLSQLTSAYGAGSPAVVAFQQQMLNKTGGSYNPTAASGIANQNVTQSMAYQQQATDINTGMSQLQSSFAPIQGLLTHADINQQDVPAFNGSINQYSSQFLNPANQASLKTGIEKLKQNLTTMLGSDPEMKKTLDSIDLGSFTSDQLNSFISNANAYAQGQLAGLQKSSQGGYGGSQGYTGGQATPSTGANIAPNNPTSSITATNPVTQGLIGGAMSFPQEAANLFMSIFK